MLSEEDGRAIGTLIDSPTAHTLTHMASQNGGNSSTLRQFAGSGLNVPVEIVETSTIDSTSEGADPRDHDSMEISIEEISQGEESQSLADSLVNDIKTHAQLEDMVLNPSISHSAVDSTQLTPSQHSSALTIPGVESNATQPPTDSTPSALSANSYLSNPLDPHLTMQQVSQSALQHFQEVSRTLRDEGIEISPENLATHFPHSLAESLAASLIGHSSQSSAAATILESVINQSAQLGIDYGDISDVSRVINDPNLTATSCNNEQIGNRGEMDPVLSDTHHVPVPSSPDSNFDTNELLNSSLTQDMEVTTKLANAGPVGVAAAAAIMSGRKRKRHVFESNPALRKRHCSKLMRRLKETLDELSTRVGVQVCLVTYRPSSKQEKPEPAFRIYGTSPLYGAIEEQKDRIIYMMDEQLKKQIPSSSPTMPILNKQLYELPPLVFDGIPTPVHEMTQSQLRAFIPNMLKYSTSRGKPGWGKEEMKPAWWPSDVPWQNVRSDVRSEAEKKVISWTECLRKLVVSCYTHHGRMDLLQAFEKKSQEDALVSEAQNLLSHGIDLSDVVANGGVGPLDVTGSQVNTVVGVYNI
jgi:nuclear respiratory factor 1